MVCVYMCAGVSVCEYVRLCVCESLFFRRCCGEVRRARVLAGWLVTLLTFAARYSCRPDLFRFAGNILGSVGLAVLFFYNCIWC